MTAKEFAELYMGHDVEIVSWNDNPFHHHVGKVGKVAGIRGGSVYVELDPPLDGDVYRPDRRYFLPDELKVVELPADRKKPLPLPG